MITWDEIDSSALLLGDQQYNWKLLSQMWIFNQESTVYEDLIYLPSGF